jgi:hypothetical protein
MLNCRIVAAAIVALTLLAGAASAQTPATPTVGVEAFFQTLYRPAIQDVQANGGPTLTLESFGGAFVLTGLLISEVANLPIGSNAGGFAWTYDSTLGTWSRAGDSFGAQFVERAQTAGRRKANVGMAYQRFTFDHLNGQPLSSAGIDASGVADGSLPPPQRLNLQERASFTRADVTISTMFVNYGLTSAIDIGILVPVMSVVLDGQLQYTLRRTTPNVTLTKTVAASARSQLNGDPLIRGKWNFFRRPSGSVALAVDIKPHSRRPLSAGGHKVQGIATVNVRGVNAHLNTGRSTYNCDGSPDHACGNVGAGFIGGGIDKAVTKRVTLSSTVHLYHTVIAVGAPATTPSQSVNIVKTEVKTNRVTASMTGKVNVWGNLLVTMTGLMSKNARGLSDRFTPFSASTTRGSQIAP